MIIYNRKDKDMEIECDECEETEYVEGGSWHDCWNELKEYGWRAFKSEGEWKHRCPDCGEEKWEG